MINRRAITINKGTALAFQFSERIAFILSVTSLSIGEIFPGCACAIRNLREMRRM